MVDISMVIVAGRHWFERRPRGMNGKPRHGTGNHPVSYLVPGDTDPSLPSSIRRDVDEPLPDGMGGAASSRDSESPTRRPQKPLSQHTQRDSTVGQE